ncbi:hypothetical protein [Streptomyces sp. NPDC020681]|uniref:hypothetical protein n=1 Tax=Streptomyces sp. NPDC020681 TaxID=3365083 RepID=UPI0037896D80
MTRPNVTCVALAVALLAVDAVASLIAYYIGMDAAGYGFFDTGADNSECHGS